MSKGTDEIVTILGVLDKTDLKTEVTGVAAKKLQSTRSDGSPDIPVEGGINFQLALDGLYCISGIYIYFMSTFSHLVSSA